jgi:hypothetical protein
MVTFYVQDQSNTRTHLTAKITDHADNCVQSTSRREVQYKCLIVMSHNK